MPQLYHWNAVGCLKQYSYGDIIVMAESLEEARKMAREYMVAWTKEWREWWYIGPDLTLHEDFQEDYDAFWKRLEEDLKAEPDVKDPAVVFIRGSE